MSASSQGNLSKRIFRMLGCKAGYSPQLHFFFVFLYIIFFVLPAKSGRSCCWRAKNYLNMATKYAKQKAKQTKAPKCN